MTRSLWIPALAFAAFAQQAAPPAFEVASVKIANPNPPPPGATWARVGSGCRRPDPGMVTCTNATMKMLLAQAYEVKNFQIEGPAWLDSGGYDLMAKIPEGVPVTQVPAMLQALLAERFQVVLHKETRSLPAYELTIAKGGPKLKEVDPAEVAAFNAAQEAARGGSPAQPAAPAARGGSMPLGTLSIRISTNGARTYRGKMTMTQLVNMLTSNLGRPVNDLTGLKGTYEIELTYLADESDPLQTQIRSSSAASGAGGDAAHPAVDADAPIATLIQAVQQSLGLKLEAKKAPVEILVIESANKVPTEN